MKTPKTINMRVERAGYYYIGHYRWAELKIILECSGLAVVVCPRLCSDEFSLFDLFKVFDIDPEDGEYLQAIEGEYCRVIFNEKGKVTALQHLTKDNIIWHVTETAQGGNLR